MHLALALSALVTVVPAESAALDDAEFAKPACEEQVGDDGEFKVLVEHVSSNGRVREVCVDLSSWEDDHSTHPGDVCLSCDAAAHPSALLEAPELAKPVCEEQVGDDGEFKVLVEHVSRNGQVREVCVDLSSWEDDHSTHPGDVCLSCDAAPAPLAQPVCEEQVGDDGEFKVLVLHRGREVCVEASSVEDHLAHGDALAD